MFHHQTGHQKHVNWLSSHYGLSPDAAEREARRREHLYPQEASRWEDPLV